MNSSQPLWIDVKSNLASKGDTWLARQIVSQSATGAVKLESLDKKFVEVIDLSEFEWRWRNGPPLGEADPRLLFGQYDPLVRDRNSPFAHPVSAKGLAHPAPGCPTWRVLIWPLYKKYRPNDTHNFDRILAKYYRNEEAWYKTILGHHQGIGKSFVANRYIPRGVCRVCLKEGHWGNECPSKTSSRDADLHEALESALSVPQAAESDDESLPDFDVPETRLSTSELGYSQACKEEVEEEPEPINPNTPPATRRGVQRRGSGPTSKSEYADAPWNALKRRRVQ